jgi:hypothetical protein
MLRYFLLKNRRKCWKKCAPMQTPSTEVTAGRFITNQDSWARVSCHQRLTANRKQMKEANSNAHGMIESNPYASSDEPEVNVSPVERSSNQATSAAKMYHSMWWKN